MEYKEIIEEESIMYCPKCGKKNDEDAKFCLYCGEAIEDDQPETVTWSEFLLNRAGVFWKGQLLPWLERMLQFFRRHLIVTGAVVCVVVLLAVSLSVISYLVSPKRAVEFYFKSCMDSDWKGVYQHLYLPESPFLNEEAFADIAESTFSPGEYLDYRIESVPSMAGDSLYSTYTVEYSTPLLSAPSQMTVTLVKSGKQLLLFDQYKVSLEGLIAEKCVVIAPAGTQLFLDDVAVEVEQDENGLFQLPMLFAGVHTLAMEHPVYQCEPLRVDMSSGCQYNLFSNCQVNFSSLTNSEIGDVTQYFADLFESAVPGESLESTGLPVSNRIGSEARENFQRFQEDRLYRESRRGKMSLKSVTLTDAWLDSGENLVECQISFVCQCQEDDDWEGSASIQVEYQDNQWKLIDFFVDI